MSDSSHRHNNKTKERMPKPKEMSFTRLYQKIHQMLLQEWDPIGIKEEPLGQKEYDPYVPKLVSLVSRCAAEQEIFHHLWWVETRKIELPGNRSHTEKIAKQFYYIGLLAKVESLIEEALGAPHSKGLFHKRLEQCLVQGCSADEVLAVLAEICARFQAEKNQKEEAFVREGMDWINYIKRAVT